MNGSNWQTRLAVSPPKAHHQKALPINNSLTLKCPPISECYFQYTICFLTQMRRSISHPCMFYNSNKILSLSTRCGIFKSSIHAAARVAVESQKGPLGRKVRYQLLWPRQMSARQSDHLWPRGEEKNQKRLYAGSLKDPVQNVRQIFHGGVRCQSDISVSIQSAAFCLLQ